MPDPDATVALPVPLAPGEDLGLLPLPVTATRELPVYRRRRSWRWPAFYTALALAALLALAAGGWTGVWLVATGQVG